jgi:hypothetical protein
MSVTRTLVPELAFGFLLELAGIFFGSFLGACAIGLRSTSARGIFAIGMFTPPRNLGLRPAGSVVQMASGSFATVSILLPFEVHDIIKHIRKQLIRTALAWHLFYHERKRLRQKP